MSSTVPQPSKEQHVDNQKAPTIIDATTQHRRQVNREHSRKHHAKKREEKVKHQTEVKAKTVTKCVRKHNLGLGVHGGSTDGEFPEGTMAKIIEVLIAETGLCETSIFLDAGSSRGGPGIAAAQLSGCISVGIESVVERHFEAAKRMLDLSDNVGKGCGKRIKYAPVYGDLMRFFTFEPATHMYMFNCGFVRELYKHLAVLFNESKTLQWLVFTKDWESPQQLGFHIHDKPIHKFSSMQMRANGNSRTVFVYRKLTPLPRPGLLDPVAMGPVAKAVDLVQQKTRFVATMEKSRNAWLESSRPVRQTKCSKMA